MGGAERSKPKPVCLWCHWPWLRGLSTSGPLILQSGYFSAGKAVTMSQGLGRATADNRQLTWRKLWRDNLGSKEDSIRVSYQFPKRGGEGGLGDQKWKMWLLGHHIPCGMGRR